ncbi:Protein argonaute 11 [Zea mays]|uniref:Protein argonaute 11 n=1 Tax=Zea mays TaxID=4577 RepID=A0A3L6FYP7_MAIZE|nr:Protein argonaute 11 [Zea mays]
MSRIGNWKWEDHRPPSGVCKGTSSGQAVLISGYSDGKSKFSMRHASEEQFSRFLLYEVDAIRKACASLEEGYLPPVTFIVVQKRHHTRFCPEDHCSHKQTDRRGNILPGTAVDTKICHPSESDFYLCSHSSIHVNRC